MATRKPKSESTRSTKPAAKKAAPAKKKTAAAAPKKKAAAKPAKKAVVPKKTAAPKKAAAPKPAKDEGFLLASTIVEGILDRKGENIVCLDLRKIENAVCDYFIIAEGNSNVQVEAIADSAEDMVKKKLGQRPYRSEGWENALWILIDYVNVVVHVFQRETRQFYNLESIWADGEQIDFGQGITPLKKAKAKKD